MNRKISYRDTPEVIQKFRDLWDDPTKRDEYYEFCKHVDHVELEEMLKSNDQEEVKLAKRLMAPPTAEDRWQFRILEGQRKKFERIMNKSMQQEAITPVTPFGNLRNRLHDVRHKLNEIGYNDSVNFNFSSKAKKHLENVIDDYYLFLNEMKRMGVDLGDYS
jgi:hypothetical protein